MAIEIGSLVVEMSANVARLQSDMDKARQTVSTAARDMKTAYDSVRSSFAALGVTLGVGLSGAALVSFTKSAIGAQAELHKLAKVTGATVEGLSSIKSVAKLSGSSLNEVAGAMQIMARNLAGVGVEGNKTSQALAAIGVDAEKLRAMKADQAMLEIARALSQYEDGLGKTAAMQAIFGRSGAQLAEVFDDLAERGNLQGRVTREQAAAADELQRQIAALNAVNGRLSNDLASAVVPMLNEVMTGFSGAKDSAADFGFAAEAIRTVLEAVVILGANVAFVFKTTGMEIGAWAAQLNALAHGNLAGFNAISDAVKADAERARKELDDFERRVLNPFKQKSGVQYWDARDYQANKGKGQVSLSGESPALATALAREKSAYDAVRKSLTEKIAAQEADLNSIAALTAAEKEYAQFLASITAGVLKLTPAEMARAAGLWDQYLNLSKLNEAEKQHAKAIEEAWKIEARRLDDMTKSTEAIEAQLKQAQLENEEIGLTVEQLDALKLARLDATIAAKEQEAATAALTSTSAAEIELLNDQVAALKELRGVMASSQAKTATADALKEQQAAWEKFTDDIERSLTDSLYRAFESGENFGAAFVKSLQNTIKAAALKLAVQVVVSTGSGAVSNALSMGNTLQMGNSAYNLATPGNLYNSFAMSSVGSQIGLSTAYVDTLGGTLGLAEGGTALTGLGNALPWIGGALAVASLLGAFDSGGGPKTEGELFATIGQSGTQNASASGAKLITADVADTYVAPLVESLSKSIQDMAKALGGDAAGVQVGLGFAYDAQGDAQDIITGNVNLGGTEVYTRALEGYARNTYPQELANEANRVLLAALRSLDLNDLADSFLDSLDIAGLSADAATQAVAFVQATQSIVDAFGHLGIGADKVTTALITALGGLDAALAGLDAYYQGYYSEAERIANLSASLSGKFADLGLAMPATRDEFRAMVESLDLTTDAGQSTYASLIGMAGAFGTVADASAVAAEAAVKQAAATIKSAQQIEAAQNAFIFANTIDIDRQQKKTMQRALEDAVAPLQDKIATFAAAVAPLRDFRQQLLGGSDVRRADAYAFTQGEFQRTLNLARLGNTEAMGKLPGAGQSYLDAAKAQAKTREDYLRDFYSVTSGTGAVIDVADRQLAVAEQQLKMLEGILGAVDPDAAEKNKSIGDAMMDMLNNTHAFVARDALKLLKKMDDFNGYAPDGSLLPTYKSAFDVVRSGWIGDGGSNPTDKQKAYVAKFGTYADASATGTLSVRYRFPDSTSPLSESESVKAFREELRALRDEIRAGNVAVAKATQETAKTLRRWEGDGMPETRVVA